MTDQQQDEWGPWIDHDGRGCPVVGMVIEFHCKFYGGEEEKHIGRVSRRFASSMVWRSPHAFDFLRYRIRKPRGMAILEQALQAQEVDA